MFVVALYEKSYIENYYTVESLISVHASTKSAQNRIDEILRNKKISKLRENYRQECLNEYEKSHPRPPMEIEARKSKPKYDQNFKGDKEYEAQHLIAVNEWKEKVLNPILIAQQEYIKEFSSFNEHIKKTVNIISFNEKKIEAVEVENIYRMEIIEVED